MNTLFTVIVLLVLQQCRGDGYYEYVRGLASRYTSEKKFDPTEVRKEYEDQVGLEPVQDWSAQVNRNKVNYIDEFKKFLPFTTREKLFEIQNTTCIKYDTCLKCTNLFWVYRDNQWVVDEHFFDIYENYFTWKQPEGYTYWRNAVPDWFINLSNYDERGIILYHNENATLEDHPRCQWKIITDPGKEVILEYHQPTQGEANIKIMSDLIDQDILFGGFKTLRISTWDKEQNIITKKPDGNVTQLLVGIEKQTDDVNYTLIIKQVEYKTLPNWVTYLIISIFMSSLLFFVFLCNKYRNKDPNAHVHMSEVSNDDSANVTLPED